MRLLPISALLLWLAAMAAYPGWNTFEPDTTGYDVRHNFLCDLISARTPDGQPNETASLLMTSCALLLLGSLLLLWWRIPKSHAWRTLARVLGLASALLTLTVIIEQTLDLPLPHGAITLGAGFAGMVPTIVAAFFDWRAPNTSRLRRLLLGTMLTAIATNFLAYLWSQLGGSLTQLVPIAQSTAMLCLIAWLTLHPLSPTTPQNDPA